MGQREVEQRNETQSHEPRKLRWGQICFSVLNRRAVGVNKKRGRMNRRGTLVSPARCCQPSRNEPVVRVFRGQ